MLPSFSRASRALLRSQSGPAAGRALSTLPVGPETRIQSELQRVLLIRRLRLPRLGLSALRCRCGGVLDRRGDHRAACATAGVLHPRAKPLERALARVCREAGARVATNVFVRDLNLEGVSPHDGRQIEVVANGLPLWNGQQLALDATIVSPVKRNGSSQPGAHCTDGKALRTARRRKEVTYHELLDAARCRLVVFAVEVGGRWSAEAIQLVRLLAQAKARASPVLLRRSAELAYYTRWTGVLAVAAHSAIAASLVEGDLSCLDGVDSEIPELHEVLAETRAADAPAVSRLPPRRQEE